MSVSNDHQSTEVAKVREVTYSPSMHRPFQVLTDEELRRPFASLVSAKAALLRQRHVIEALQDRCMDWEDAHIRSLPDLTQHLSVEYAEVPSRCENVLTIRPDSFTIRMVADGLPLPNNEATRAALIQKAADGYAASLSRTLYATLYGTGPTSRDLGFT